MAFRFHISRYFRQKTYSYILAFIAIWWCLCYFFMVCFCFLFSVCFYCIILLIQFLVFRRIFRSSLSYVNYFITLHANCISCSSTAFFSTAIMLAGFLSALVRKYFQHRCMGVLNDSTRWCTNASFCLSSFIRISLALFFLRLIFSFLSLIPSPFSFYLLSTIFYDQGVWLLSKSLSFEWTSAYRFII